jgi:hypothetical protein
MTKSKISALILFLIIFSWTNNLGIACSGYKITVGNTTIFGSNEDAWRTTPHIWFENATEPNKFGAAFTGSRWDGENGYAPQAGMNEMGLAFERLASYHPKLDKKSTKRQITNPTKYLKDILHTCKTVEEVRDYISNYDQSYFIEDVFMYVDKSGKYLIVEPYQLTIADDPTYVISNFCPSITSEADANQLERYKNGSDLLKSKSDTSLAFCTLLSDTMHVCREKIGDGTLLTSIWDLNKGMVTLYFYHNYDTSVQFNLQEELSKGDHLISVESLFPKNAEFEQLRDFKIPKNTLLMGVFIVGAAGLFLFTSIFFLVVLLRRKKDPYYPLLQVTYFLLSLMLFYYMYVLSGSVNVYYFPAPYKNPTNVFVSASSYLPFLLLLLIIPSLFYNFRIVKMKLGSVFTRIILTTNNIIYLMLIGLFFYWGFYDVFG